MILELTERPYTEVRGDDALVIFPSRPYWFTASREVIEVLDVLCGPVTEESAVASVARRLDVLPAEAAETVAELRDLLASNKVLTLDGHLAQVAADLEPHVQVNPIENVVVIAATHGCNLDCPQCYPSAKHAFRNELSTEEIKHLVDSLDNLGWDHASASVGLTGGEILTRADAFDLIDYIAARGYAVVLATNALLLTDSGISRLTKLGDRVKISVSLDGPTADVHEYIRGVGTFAPTVTNIRKLTDAALGIGVNMFVHRGNVEHIEATLALARPIGARSFNCLGMMMVGRANAERSRERVERVPEDELFGRLFQILRSNATYRELMKNSTFANQLMGIAAGVKSHYCGVGAYRALYVRADGEVYPCPDTGLPVFRLGNVRSESLAQIWQNSSLLPKLRELNVDTMNQTCASCEVRYQCGGNCRGENFQVTHDLRAPHFKCEELRRTIKSMMWMITDEPELFADKVAGLYRTVCA